MIKRLMKYLEQVEQNIKSSDGELHQFWLREKRKTAAKIAGATK